MATTAQTTILSAGTITGDKVRNKAGEELGDIKELMIDLRSGRVVYAVLSFGGFLGLGDKLFAVPWAALAPDLQEHKFVLDVSKESLEKAPGFDKDNWPSMAEQRWQEEVHAHYETTPYWEENAYHFQG